MKSAETKLVLFLADPELSEKDFARLAHLFGSSELSRCLSAAAYLRKQSRPAAEHIKRMQREVTREFEDRGADPEFLKDVSRLLSKTKLGPAETMRRLSEELGIDIDGSKPKTLRAGITRLLEVADMKQIWAAAERIKEKAVSGPPKHAWPLSGSTPDDGRL